MKIIVSGKWIKGIEDMLPVGEFRDRFHQKFGWYREEKKAKIDIADWPDGSLCVSGSYGEDDKDISA